MAVLADELDTEVEKKWKSRMDFAFVVCWLLRESDQNPGDFHGCS